MLELQIFTGRNKGENEGRDMGKVDGRSNGIGLVKGEQERFTVGQLVGFFLLMVGLTVGQLVGLTVGHKMWLTVGQPLV